MAAHFEARKWAYRQTKEGTVVSFLIHPNDLNSDFAVADLGTRYMVAFAKIGDDEKPIAESSSQGQPSTGDAVSPTASSANLPKKRFHELPLSQQAALACNDRGFRDWLSISFGETWADVVVNAPQNQDLRAHEVAAEVIRSICDVSSRSKIAHGSHAGETWTRIYSQFLTETGRQPEQRG